jgi:peptide/nickel transport system permease protein
MRISYAILLGASLGFLGLGVQPPAPDWGLMISEARSFLLVAPWMAVAPALAMASLVVGLNLVADGLSGEIDDATGR